MSSNEWAYAKFQIKKIITFEFAWWSGVDTRDVIDSGTGERPVIEEQREVDGKIKDIRSWWNFASSSDMSVQVELLVHHGGRMQFNGRAAQYVGGEVVEVTFDSDYLCYFQLMKIGTEDLKYDSVEKIWFVAPGMSLSDGLEQVLNDTDAEKIGEAGKKGVVEVYLDTTTVESGYGDNEEVESEWHNGLSGSDPEAEVSGVGANVGVVHLLDDSDRTSDPEFLEAMANLGVSQFRRSVRTTVSGNGVEVEQLAESALNRRQLGPRAREEIVVDPNVMVDLATMDGNVGASLKRVLQHLGQGGGRPQLAVPVGRLDTMQGAAFVIVEFNGSSCIVIPLQISCNVDGILHSSLSNHHPFIFLRHLINPSEETTVYSPISPERASIEETTSVFGCSGDIHDGFTMMSAAHSLSNLRGSSGFRACSI
ncbi:hypothetical protein LINPERHAP2_LOCUS25038 [Linum perenne]